MVGVFTYADLNKTLLSLGFERREFEGRHYIYDHEASDTLITFPIVDMQMRVRASHLITSRKMIVERGIADEETFVQRLMENAQQGNCHDAAPVTVAA